jgi:DNA polymerase-1
MIKNLNYIKKIKIKDKGKLMENQNEVVLIDAHNLIYRAFFGNKNKLTNHNNLPTNAIYTTITMLKKIENTFQNMKYCLVVYDSPKKNFREEISDDYKAQRAPMPDDLKIQLPFIKEAINILGWPTLEVESVEADDVLATFGSRSSMKGFKTYIISGDKDFRQLINDNLVVVDTMKDIYYDEATVLEKMEIPSKYVIDYLSLIGDSSDNVAGVDKVGPKTAVKLLNEYQGLVGIQANLEKIKGVVGENLKKAFESGMIEKNISLITLKKDLPLSLTAKELSKKPLLEPEWIEFCETMNFNSFLKKGMKPTV